MRIFGFLACVISLLPRFHYLNAGSLSHVPFEHTIQVKLDNELAENFKKHNWKYDWGLFPSTDGNSLTYGFYTGIHMKNVAISSQDEAKKLFFKIYKDFIYIVNSTRSIRPFLANYPITPDDAFFGIGFDDENGRCIRPPYICCVTVTPENTLEMWHYSTKPEHALPFSFQTVYQKPVREVPELVALYTPDLPTHCDYKPEIPTQRKLGLGQISPIEYAGLEFAHSFANRHDLHLLRTGLIGKHPFDKYSLQFALRGSQTLLLNEVRPLIVACLKESLHLMHTDRRYVKHMKERGADPFWKDPATVAEPRHIAFRISFWDEKVDRVPEPYIAEVHAFGGHFKYFTSDQYQRLVLVHEETFEQAKEIVEAQKL
jgi:hypothetical protein